MVLENLTLGNLILYATAIISLTAIAGLALKEFKNSDVYMNIMPWLIRAAAAFLTIDLLLLAYYFIAPDYTYMYVWQFSSRDLPLLYKISGVWAGQAGTYLFWTWVVFLSILWVSERERWNSSFIRKTQMISLLIGIYFILLTSVESPFKLIYAVEPNLPPDFVPPDGSGLNALLINPWMAVHPPVVFIAYGAAVMPFAAALTYLLTMKGEWEPLARQWARFAWLFLTLGIAIGGVWAYLVLGWGGFWSWDPVETSSLIPWLTLTGFLHALSIYRRDKQRFNLASAVLACVTFILVVYAAMVTRSGLFNSVHAFGDAPTGTLLLILIGVATVASLVLGIKRYSEAPERGENSDFINKSNIFYLTLLIFVVLSFISLWGISFPVLIQLAKGVKVSIASDTKSFFNVWSYPAMLILLLVLGFCLQYSKEDKRAQIRVFAAVTGLTIVAALLRTQNFYVLDHSSPFFISEPPVYKILGSISLASLFPPLIYSLSGVVSFASRIRKIKKSRVRVASTGIVFIHVGIALILFGAVISTMFTDTLGVTLPMSSKGERVDIGGGYGIKLEKMETGKIGVTQSYPGVRIADIYAEPQKYLDKTVTVGGRVSEVINVQSDPMPITYVKLDDGTGSLWVAFEQVRIAEGLEISASGVMLSNFKSNATGRIFDLILFSSADSIEDLTQTGGAGSYQRVYLEVYKDGKRVGRGFAEYVTGKAGDSATHPLVDRNLLQPFWGDVYVIFQGFGGGSVPLTLKIIPAMNLLWLGVLLFSAGIILIMATNTRGDGQQDNR
jgi:cytochrome c-type biogenesis protein CcmF